MSAWSQSIGVALLVLGLVFCFFTFGLSLWIVLGTPLVYAAIVARFGSPTAALVAAYAFLGYAFTVYLFGQPLWIGAVAGLCAVALLSFLAKSNATVQGENVNPVPYLVLAVAARFWLSLIYTAVVQITDGSFTVLGGLGVFVLAVVPDFPVVVNVIDALVINGSLILWGALLIKRILSPVAN